MLGAGLLTLLVAATSGCEKTGGEVIDSSKLIPYQFRAEILPDSVDTDSINVGPERLPDDILPITISAESYFSDQLLPVDVQLSLLSTDGSSVLTTGELSLSGPVHPILGQKYTTVLTFTIRRTVVGNLQVEFVGTSQDGSTSNTIRLPLSIVRLNAPPVLSNLQAPDTVALENIQQFLLLQVDVQDANGSDDIRLVYFNSTRPNGSPSSGNPFIMYDDGSNGDIQPNDGTYSLLVVLPPTTAVGTYNFEFQAVDKSDSLSVPIVHLITVKQ